MHVAIRRASASDAPSIVAALRTAVASSRCAPASVPAGVRNAPSDRLTVSPKSDMSGLAAPTVAMASDTRIMRCAVFARNAARADAGCTWIPSSISPVHASARDRAAPSAPGLRDSSGGMALNRCVKHDAPASSARAVVSKSAAVCPRLTRTPAVTSVAISPGETHSGASVTIRGNPRGAVSRSRSAASSGRRFAAGWTPRRGSDNHGPSRCSPIKPSTPSATAAATALMAARVLSRLSLISVAIRPVTPNFR